MPTKNHTRLSAERLAKMREMAASMSVALGPRDARELLRHIDALEESLNSLAIVVGQALLEASLVPDESLLVPCEHALVEAVHGLRLRAEAAEMRVKELEETLREWARNE